MNLREQLKRIRRYLRDPDGNIWSRDLLINLYNDAQENLQIQTRFLENAQTLRTPTLYQFSYMYDWEWGQLSGTQFYQALRFHEQGEFSFTMMWESQLDFGGTTPEYGTMFTHPWEAWYTDPAQTVKVKFPENYHTTKLLAYDQKAITKITKKEITVNDSSYITTQGEPQYYYREDDLDNSFTPYPRPSTIVWDDPIDSPVDPDFLYTFDWESTLLTGNGENWTEITSNLHHVFEWEKEGYGGEDFGIRGMYLFELDVADGVSVLYDSRQTSGTGTYATRSATLFNQDTGITIDVLDDVDNFFLIFDITPTRLVDDSDESDFPKFLRKYIEYEVISRAYGANTDGRIKSLSDYWNLRHLQGLERIRLFMKKRRQDRNYQLRTGVTPTTRLRRQAKLPSTYPVI